jgi:hypothetical protein
MLKTHQQHAASWEKNLFYSQNLLNFNSRIKFKSEPLYLLALGNVFIELNWNVMRTFKLSKFIFWLKSDRPSSFLLKKVFDSNNINILVYWIRPTFKFFISKVYFLLIPNSRYILHCYYFQTSTTILTWKIEGWRRILIFIFFIGGACLLF